jgi:acetyl-CoA decarbonylase/synthase complex subunit gamma
VPVELVHAWKPILLTTGLLFVAAVVGTGRFQAGESFAAVIAYLGAVLTGIVATPLLLPWLPTASFAVKGALAGAGWTALYCLLAGGGRGAATTAAAMLALPAVSAFFALNFTGSTPFASRSGVKKEMRLTMPAMGGALLGGALIWLCGKVL